MMIVGYNNNINMYHIHKINMIHTVSDTLTDSDTFKFNNL